MVGDLWLFVSFSKCIFGAVQQLQQDGSVAAARVLLVEISLLKAAGQFVFSKVTS